MQKKRIEYDSPVEAIVAIAKRLSVYEARYHLPSEEFFDDYSKGKMEDSLEFVEWANDYRHFLDIKQDLERCLRHVALHTGSIFPNC